VDGYLYTNLQIKKKQFLHNKNLTSLLKNCKLSKSLCIVIFKMMLRTCQDCNESKDEATAFERMPTGKYRNQCKKCKNARRKNANASEAAKKARSDRRDTTPLPSACVQCGKGPSEVEFRWRDDVKKGGWRETCTACYNAKKYHATYRDKKNQEDPETFRAHNTAVHLTWVLQNPDRMREYQELQRTDPERKFKALLTYVRAKNRKNGTVIDKDGGDEGEEEEEGEEDVDDEKQRRRLRVFSRHVIRQQGCTRARPSPCVHERCGHPESPLLHALPLLLPHASAGWRPQLPGPHRHERPLRRIKHCGGVLCLQQDARLHGRR